ncbi:hypothetical protein EKI60_06055 [Candidatus Saccharibacteria bacterium]|nr:MAG: hypothetical protein EKI60_06055 [Candidatus Saccharibacteria bacterium]
MVPGTPFTRAEFKPNLQNGLSQNRGLCKARGGDIIRCVHRQLAAPNITITRVLERVIKYHMGDHAVGPLPAQNTAQLGLSSFDIFVTQSNSNKAAIPKPLVRVQAFRRNGEVSSVVIL